MTFELRAAHRGLRSAGHAERSVAQIAYDCGFVDLSHFARRFRMRFDRTPGEVRRRSPGPALEAPPAGGGPAS